MKWSRLRRPFAAKLCPTRTQRRSLCLRETMMLPVCCRRRRWTALVVSQHSSIFINPKSTSPLLEHQLTSSSLYNYSIHDCIQCSMLFYKLVSALHRRVCSPGVKVFCLSVLIWTALLKFDSSIFLCLISVLCFVLDLFSTVPSSCVYLQRQVFY